MRNKFNKKIAKEIALKQFEWTLGCIGLGSDDMDYNLDTNIENFETSFTEELEEKNITVTQKRIEVINNIYTKYIDTAKLKLENYLKKLKNGK